MSLLLALAAPRRKGFVTPLLLALLAASITNVMHFVPEPDELRRLAIFNLLTSQGAAIIGNAVAALLFIWAVVRAVRAASGRLQMARTLERRGDFLGAAEIYVQAGDPRRALALFTKGRAWDHAAKAALDLGREEEAAELMRRAGGRHLAEAARIYRQLGNRQAAIRCDYDLAEWLTSEGRFDEGIEAWLRAGQPQRALRATNVALSENRLQPSHPAFARVRRAAEETHDYRTLGRLREVEGSWLHAAYAWRDAGEHTLAAVNFRKAGRLDEAAVSEAAAGHLRESAQLRLRQLRSLQDKLRTTDVGGVSKTPETDRIRVQVRRETESLIPQLSELGMEDEMIEVLSSSGRTEEAVERLVAERQDVAAADLARDAQRWDLAAPILERLNRWGEASDVHELAGNLTAAARCAERAGEDDRALQIYRSLNMTVNAAHCLARLGSLQDALIELHRTGRHREACEILRSYPGPVPDIPTVILDMAEWAYENASPEDAIACLQRAVVGVAMQPSRLDPAVALARLLHEVGETESAMAEIERVLAFDFSYEPARTLKSVLELAQGDSADTKPSAVESRVEPTSAAQQRYEILTELGRGGMGVVYKARDTRLERDVAIKVLRTTSPEEVSRLQQEAKAAATLNHPGIVTIFDFEAGFDGYFITMEYVPGETLDDLIRSQPDRIRENLLRILARLADAMAYAHNHHVIHRDLKPGNILLTPLQEVKILDFGIAARLDASDSATLTVCGTPYYMAPEQIRGDPPSPATDVYAFGATSFHLATGRPPFKEGNVIDAHLNQPPPSPEQFNPALPNGLADIILRCLEKDTASRFVSAEELRDRLLELRTN